MLGMPAPCKVEAKLEISIGEVKLGQLLEQSRAYSYPSPSNHSYMTLRSPGPTSRLLAFAAIVLTGAGLACGNVFGVPASLPTFSDSGVVYAINGAPPGAPTALNIFSGTLLAANANFIFDVAFDIDSSGQVIILPEPAVASGLATAFTVSLQSVGGSFDDLTRAPGSGYRADTALVAPPNTLVVVQSSDPNACGTSLTGTTIYAKLMVTAVDPVSRTMSLRYTVDPNCGFRSFLAGIPKD